MFMRFLRLLLLLILIGGGIFFFNSKLKSNFFSSNSQQSLNSSEELKHKLPQPANNFIQATTSQLTQTIQTQANHLLQQEFVQHQAEQLKSRLEDLTHQESQKVKYQIKYQFCQDVVETELQKRGCQ